MWPDYSSGDWIWLNKFYRYKKLKRSFLIAFSLYRYSKNDDNLPMKYINHIGPTHYNNFFIPILLYGYLEKIQWIVLTVDILV